MNEIKLSKKQCEQIESGSLMNNIPQTYTPWKRCRSYVLVMDKYKNVMSVLADDLKNQCYGNIAGIIAVADGNPQIARKYQEHLFNNLVPIMLCELIKDREKNDATATLKQLNRTIIKSDFSVTKREDSFVENVYPVMCDYLYESEYWEDEQIKERLPLELANKYRDKIRKLFEYVVNYIPHEHESKYKDVQYLREELCHKFIIDTSHIVRMDDIDYLNYTY